VYLADRGKGERIRGAEGYFLFFRGMFVASSWSAILFSLLVIFHAVRITWPGLDAVLGPRPTAVSGIFLPLCGAAVCTVMWKTFRYRCRGAAQGFAREVFRAFCALVLLEEKPKD
jgi:hypothetical protein